MSRERELLKSYEIGQKGAPHSEQERALFTEYMRGRCWECGPWNEKNGEYYDNHTRILYAVWRARAAVLSQPEAGDMTNTDKSNLGRWKDDAVDKHKGDYYYKCSVCGVSDWIARYGTLEQLRCKCNEKISDTPRTDKLDVENRFRHVRELIRLGCEGDTPNATIRILVDELTAERKRPNDLMEIIREVSKGVQPCDYGKPDAAIRRFQAMIDGAMKNDLEQEFEALRKRADEAERDAKRWKQALMFIGADVDRSGEQCFIIRMPLFRQVNLMRGSVSEHFTKRIDEAMKNG